MPERKTLRRAQKAAKEGKAPSTQAGEFVREEIEHVREGKHGVESTKQAIAIGLAKARRAGVKLPPPPKEVVHAKPGEGGRKAASTAALSKQARASAKRRGPAKRKAAARKAARTRARNR